MKKRVLVGKRMGKLYFVLSVFLLVGTLTACNSKSDKENKNAAEIMNQNSVETSVEESNAIETNQNESSAVAPGVLNETEASEETSIESEQSTSSSTTKSTEVVVEDKTIDKKKWKVTCPQISGMKNDVLETQCNQILEKYIADITDTCNEKDTFEVGYEVTEQNSDYISIVLKGYLNVQQSAHPSFLIHTLNIDLKHEKLLRLSEMADLSSLAKRILVDKAYTVYSLEGEIIEDEYEKAIKDFIDQTYTQDFLMTELEKVDINPDSLEEPPYQYSYIKDDTLHLFLSVPTALGEYVDVELGNVEMK